MIWFQCSQCGKTHGRPANSAGSLVFCECGQGNAVPWESTTPPPAPADVPALDPVLFPKTVADDRGAPKPTRQGPRLRKERAANDCFNHPDDPAEAKCADCGESFCASCLTSLRGQTLCGPCKNFRVRRLEMPPLNASLATASLVISLFSLPLALCMLPAGWGWASRTLSVVSLLPQFLALALGGRAIYLAEKENKVGSQAMAITGVASASVAVLLTVLFQVYVARFPV